MTRRLYNPSEQACSRIIRLPSAMCHAARCLPSAWSVLSRSHAWAGVCSVTSSISSAPDSRATTSTVPHVGFESSFASSARYGQGTAHGVSAIVPHRGCTSSTPRQVHSKTTDDAHHHARTHRAVQKGGTRDHQPPLSSFHI